MAEENRLERRLTEAVKGAGGLCIKLPALLYRGIPDRMILLPGGRIYFVELKARNGRASVHQTRFQQILFTLGFISLIIKGETHLEEFIADHVQGVIRGRPG